ncbi:MAG: hypothetical protein RL591_579 [Planctomycetota bacterium]
MGRVPASRNATVLRRFAAVLKPVRRSDQRVDVCATSIE